MKQEEKQLLLVDLCARLPYGVKVNIEAKKKSYTATVCEITRNYICVEGGGEICFSHGSYKTYLRPMSSMTEEEREELSKRYVWNICGRQIQIRYHSQGYWDDETECPTEEYIELFNWLNKKMFDYRGLIPMGLGLEMPEDMYNTKTE